MTLFFKRAIQDIKYNRFLSTVTIITIALSILIVSTFAVFVINVNDIMRSWEKGIRIMAYLKPDIPETVLVDLEQKLKSMYGVRDVRFISKEDALNRLKEQMKHQSSILENLKENPLPDAFEIRMIASLQGVKKAEDLSTRIEVIPLVDEVEYGKKWLGQFVNIFNLFRLTGYAIGGLFFMAAILIVANTIRLVLYSRREEIDIMRLVGATDSFIKIPFYIQGLAQGALGGLIGLLAVFAVFVAISSNIKQGLASDLLHIRFLSIKVQFGIILCSMFVGYLGCYISLKQFLKE